MHTDIEKKQEVLARSISTGSHELEHLIANAIKKIGGNKENDLCRYLPMVSGGYMHHFTLRKMRHQDPARLSEMIKRFIVDIEKPLTVKPKPRIRGANKKKGQVVLNDTDIGRLIQLARAAGDRDMVRRLTPRRELKALKRELISSIRRGIADQNLWNTYADFVETAN
jgi:hypothetical protein